MLGVKDIETKLGDLADLVTIEETKDCFYIKPKKWLGTENWRKIDADLKELNGEWLRMAKASHWEIPFEGAPSPKVANDVIRHEAMKLIATLQHLLDVHEDAVSSFKECIAKLEKLTK